MNRNCEATTWFLPPCRGKARMGVEIRRLNKSTPSLTLPLHGGGDEFGGAHE